MCSKEQGACAGGRRERRRGRGLGWFQGGGWARDGGERGIVRTAARGWMGARLRPVETGSRAAGPVL